MDSDGGSTMPGNLLTLWGCVNDANQIWQFIDLCSGGYKPRNHASESLMLDDPAGSNTQGTQLGIWTDNGLAPQQWLVQ